MQHNEWVKCSKREEGETLYLRRGWGWKLE